MIITTITHAKGKYQGCTRLAAVSDKVYQLLAHGRWFSPGNPASTTTKTGRHNIAEILLVIDNVVSSTPRHEQGSNSPL
jgi:hypothetical protein